MATGRIRQLAIITALLSHALNGCQSTTVSKQLLGLDKFSVSEKGPSKLPFIDRAEPSPPAREVMPVAYEEPEGISDRLGLNGVETEPLPKPLTFDETGQEERFPIDLSTAFELAGANNLQIAFARQRVAQAAARVQGADVLWVPSLRAGVVYNNHSGRLQATEGDVIEVSRSSLFVGAGAISGRAPTAGGSSGPARMFVDLPLVDLLFEPLAARQAVDATQADQAVTFNDMLLAAGTAYLQLLRAESQLAIAAETVENAGILAKLTSEFSQAGQGLEADAQRAQVELANRRRELSKAREGVGVASAELARLLRLDQSVVLFPAENQPVPLELVGSEISLPALIEQALASRPEVGRQTALIAETWTRRRQESLRPWMPNFFAGFSGGGFGGSPGSSIDSFNGRGDVDIGAMWEFENLGLGNRALQREANSIHQQAHIARAQVRDMVASEVATAYRQVESRREQIESARIQVQSGMRALVLNFEGIRGGTVIRPIEAQQAIGALATARSQYVAAIVGFNEAQLFLIRSLGQPPSLSPSMLP